MAKQPDWALDDRQQLHNDANDALDENLFPNEAVHVIIRGTSHSALVGTDRRVFVFKKGWTGGTGFGGKLASWDYAHIMGVQVETALGTGMILIQAPGVAATDPSYWGSGKESVHSAPNALALTGDHFVQARQGAAALRRLVSEHQGGGRSAPVASRSADPIMTSPPPEPTMPPAQERAPEPAPPQQLAPSTLAPDKSGLVTFLLWLVLGLLGGHRYYLGRTRTAILQTLTLGGLGLWWLLDLFLLEKLVRDANGG